jgi:glycosyltransferase involved in cell wall biosynthesis
MTNLVAGNTVAQRAGDHWETHGPPTRQGPAKTRRSALKVCYIMRHPENFFFSIERMCHVLAAQISKEAEVQIFHMPFASSFWGAPANLTWLPKSRNTIYHILGDVHYAALALPKDRTVVTFCDAVLLHRYSGLKRHILLEYSYRKPIQRAAAITTISNFSKVELEKLCGGFNRRVHVVHVPIDPIFLGARSTVNGGRPKILQVGSGNQKNADVVIKALAGGNGELHIVGQPRMDLTELARRENVTVQWHNGINDRELVDLYASATLVTFASSYEGFGLPIVEAQAVGCPVITSTCCSLPEVAGDGALFVDPGNIEELRGAIHRLLNEPALRTSLIERGRHNVLRFSVQRIAAEYRAIYESLLN